MTKGKILIAALIWLFVFAAIVGVWKYLWMPHVVENLQASPLVFPRGSSHLTERSEAILDELSSSLETYPHCSLTIKSATSSEDDALAEERGQAVMDYLLDKGVERKRLRVEIHKAKSGTVSFKIK